MHSTVTECARWRHALSGRTSYFFLVELFGDSLDYMAVARQ